MSNYKVNILKSDCEISSSYYLKVCEINEEIAAVV
jgi:hypothetical protein